MTRTDAIWKDFCKIAVIVVLGILAPFSLYAQYERPEAPFGDKVSERVPAYHRAVPTVGLAGPLGRLGIMDAKAVGFKSILNLGTSTTPGGLDDVLEGGVNASIGLDGHGKSLSFLVLDMPVLIAADAPHRARETETIAPGRSS